MFIKCGINLVFSYNFGHLIVQNTLFKSKAEKIMISCVVPIVCIVVSGAAPVLIGRPVNTPHLGKDRVNSSCYVLKLSILRIKVIKIKPKLCLQDLSESWR